MINKDCYYSHDMLTLQAVRRVALFTRIKLL